MYQGKSIREIREILENQREFREDIIVKTSVMKLIFSDNKLLLELVSGSTKESYLLSELAHVQLSDWVGINYKRYQVLCNNSPELLIMLLNACFKQNNRCKLLRVRHNTILAVLSAGYLCYDNLELLNLVTVILHSNKSLRVVSADLERDIMHIKIIDLRQKIELAVGDNIYAGVVVSNGELGLHPIKIEALLYRAKEQAILILQGRSKHIYHSSKQLANGVFKQDITDYEELNIDYKCIHHLIKQNIQAAVQPIDATTRTKLAAAFDFNVSRDYPRLIDELSDSYGLTQSEKAQIYFKFSNCSNPNYLNLLCTLSYKLTADDYLRATELERIAGRELLSFGTVTN